VSALLLGALLLSGPTAEIRWLPYPQALAVARKEQRRIFVDVWADWCLPCVQMHRHTYRDPAVQEALDEFVTTQIDAMTSSTTLDRWKVDTLPAMLILDSSGRPIDRRTGYRSASELLLWLRATPSR
jgi:thiol:disulfide interchange protein